MAFEVGSIIARVKADVTDFKRGMDEAKGHTSRLTDGFKNAQAGSFALLGAVTAAAAGAVVFGVKSVEAYNASVEASTKLRTNMLNVKGATLENVESMEKLAAALQHKGVIEDDVIKAGMSQLATFNLQSSTIEKLTPKITDMVAQMKGHNATAEDMVGINNLVGKVMTGNVGALSRYGVTLSETQAKMIENGTEAEKAATLVEVLGQNYGKVNEELAKTPEGMITRMKNRFGDLQEGVGELLMTALLPLVDKLDELFFNMEEAGGVMEFLKQKFEENKTAVYAIIGAILVGLVPAFIALAGSIWAAVAPLLPFLAVGAALGALFQTLKANGIDPLKVAVDLFKMAWDFLKPSIMSLWQTIQNDLMPALRNLWNQVSPILIPALQALGMILGGALLGALWLIINGLKNGIQAFSWFINTTIAVINAVRSLDNNIRGAVAGFGGMLYGAGRALIQGLINGITSIGGAVGQRISEIAQGAVNTAKRILGIRSPSKVFEGIGENLGLGLVGGIKDTAGLVQNAINAMVPNSMDLAGLNAATNSVQTNIYGNIINGSEADRDMFFRRLNRGQETAARGAASPPGLGG